MKRQKSFETDQPTLYLVATPIGNLDELTPRALQILNEVDVIAAEDTRNTMKLLSHFGIKTRLMAHHMHNEQASAKGLIDLLDQGKSIALVSDAGYPLVSDPGKVLAEMVIENGYPLVPVSGASAVLNALVASGITPQPFLFYGFLKSSEKDRVRELMDLKYYPQTLIFYEAPHRITKTLTSCLEVLGNRKMCLARELTKKHEEFIRGTISEILEISDELKGEMVLVIEGGKETKEESLTAVDINQKIDDYMEAGLSTKEAIKKVAKEYGLSRNDLYKEYHGLN